MQTKLQQFSELSVTSSEQLWKDTKHWQSFLEISARLYKYSFKDQVLIHSQRPDAVACAEYDTWGREDIANRFVKRGSKGIALIDYSNSKPRLRYVFDFADTSSRDERSKEPFFWKVTDENENLIIKSLDINSENLDIALIEKTKSLVAEQSSDYLSELLNKTSGTFLEELDEVNIQARFEKLLENSIGYSLLSRCGVEPNKYIDTEDFIGLHEFNSIEAVTVLGKAVSDLSEHVCKIFNMVSCGASNFCFTYVVCNGN